MRRNYCSHCGAKLQREDKAVIRVELSGKPTLTQSEFMLADNAHVTFVGPMASGKTWALRRKLVLLSLCNPGVHCLLISADEQKMECEILRPLMVELRGYGNYHFNKNCFHFPNGSTLTLGYVRRDEDLYRFAGEWFHVIGLDNAECYSDHQIMYLRCLNRTDSEDIPKRMYYIKRPIESGVIAEG